MPTAFNFVEGFAVLSLIGFAVSVFNFVEGYAVHVQGFKSSKFNGST